MKTFMNFRLFAAVGMIAMALSVFSSCKKDDETKPAPQVSSDPTSFNLVPGQTETASITVVAPGSFTSLTVSADQGNAVLSAISGTDTESGSATLTYTAPDAEGNYTITLSAVDNLMQTGTKTITVSVAAKPAVNVPAGEVSGTWDANTTYIAQGALLVPAGKSLTIEEGVTIIFYGDGSSAAPELAVSGSLYCMGTENNPILITVPAAKRTQANIFAGIWGGIQGLPDASEMVLQYTNIEYVGAPTGPGNSSLYSGSPYDDGDPRYGVLFSNTDGKFVMQHSSISYTADDGMRIVGGTILISNNTFVLNGKNGGESVNIKSGVTGTVAFNMSYRAATNAYKWSNSSGTSPNPQTDIACYNNTAVDGGWRQTKTGRGGSINIEKGARGTAYNNLIVNCRFGLKVVGDADFSNLSIGYSHYYGTDTVMSNQFYPKDGIMVAGDKETASDIAGTPGQFDPMFTSYTVSNYTSAYPVDPLSLGYMPEGSDFSLQSGAPGISAGKTSFTIMPSISANGTSYSAPSPASFIGAFGAN
jgi:hypothetical protein